MQTLVIFDSKFGNTEKIAEAIGRGAGSLGSVRLVTAAEALTALQTRPDLLLVGGPTQRRSVSPGMAALLESIDRRVVAGVRTATFDTRYRGSTWIMGSAAAQIAKRLGSLGATLIERPESFFMGRSGPIERQVLEAGEVERAESWGSAVATAAAQGAAA